MADDICGGGQVGHRHLQEDFAVARGQRGGVDDQRILWIVRAAEEGVDEIGPRHIAQLEIQLTDMAGGYARPERHVRPLDKIGVYDNPCDSLIQGSVAGHIEAGGRIIVGAARNLGSFAPGRPIAVGDLRRAPGPLI